MWQSIYSNNPFFSPSNYDDVGGDSVCHWDSAMLAIVIINSWSWGVGEDNRKARDGGGLSTLILLGVQIVSVFVICDDKVRVLRASLAGRSVLHLIYDAGYRQHIHIIFSVLISISSLWPRAVTLGKNADAMIYRWRNNWYEWWPV